MGFNCKFSIMNESIRESNAHYTRVDHVVVESSSQEVMAGLLRHSTRKLYSSVSSAVSPYLSCRVTASRVHLRAWYSSYDDGNDDKW